ncbi:site-specific integrase [Achromobacter ruhlandii]|uniref:site-specific integrase n=1 Tax=Achromobacter ruhlandii TaxID=72557 RepID=UPI00234BF6D9|nr:site-specific integrase [Achromobacter ruhlandii]MDC6090345.1 site-specific integrase [Achromobacter ruhlandii]WIW04179.1 site-specific integrase [Achromobacter ruhlandii]
MKTTSKISATASKTNASKPSRSVPANTAVSMTAEHYIDAARSAATKKAYAADLAHFLANGGKLPATPQQLSAYLAKLAATLAVATIERRLVGIHRAHQDRNLTSPAVHVIVRQTMQGIRRTLGTAQRRVRALVKDELLELLALIDQQKPMKAARDRAVLLIGFAGAFRRSELVAIRCEDISMINEGIEIMLHRSKTDQEGAGRIIFIPRAKGTRCPVAALEQWKALAGIEFGYVFRRVTRHDTISDRALTSQSVALIVKAAYRRAGLDATLVAGHSLRAGYVTAAAMAGLQPFQIQQQTGHRSTATLARYIRPLERRRIPSLL